VGKNGASGVAFIPLRSIQPTPQEGIYTTFRT
jgi:hypothetical protein